MPTQLLGSMIPGDSSLTMPLILCFLAALVTDYLKVWYQVQRSRPNLNFQGTQLSKVAY